MNLVCLILEPTVIVAADLSAMVEETVADAELVAVTSEREALEALQDLARVDVAFLGIPPAGFARSALGVALARMNATVVFLGYEAEAQAMGQRYLERPFVTGAVVAELVQLRSETGGPCQNLQEQT